MNSLFELILMLLALLLAVVLHEVAHGAVALALGDTTARDAGRLSLNPLVHIDPIGTVLVPLLLALSPAPFLFGWAKPVPVNISRMRDPQLGMWASALAGPATNLAQAAVAILLLRQLMPVGAAPELLFFFLRQVVMINLVLMVFNLLPVPPLDGSRIVASVMPPDMAQSYLRLAPFGFLIIMLLLYTGLLGRLLGPLYAIAQRLITS